MSTHDVVVVGAGLAGLVAATRLRAAGLDVVVLEARDRVGGRTLDHDLGDGQVVEAGGQFIGPTQDRVLRLAGELGVDIFPAHTVGDSIYVKSGVSRRYSGDIPPDLPALPGLGLTMNRIDRAAARIPVETPWLAPRAHQLDGTTFESWLRGTSLGTGAIDLVEAFLASAFGTTAREASALFALWYISTFGNETHPGTLARGIGVAGGAQESRFIGGAQQLSIRLAAALGDRVVLSTRVTTIRQDAQRAKVLSGSRTWSAATVIVAIPPMLASRLHWDPPLPPHHQALLQRLPFGTLMKCEAVYPEPFWRADGLNGSAVFRAGSPIASMFDNTPPSGSPGVLMGFLGGAAWRTWSTRRPVERRGAVLRSFAAALGPRALRPSAYFEQDWTGEPWSLGGPTSVAAPGVLTELGLWLGRRFDRIHWAGAEVSPYWNGFMEGAVRSGERAALDVLADRAPTTHR
ncbi:flavin monoamine oxidase family protein [Nocardia takedensis]|uniref:flavin monoamine oxidase family protein n=1 Tax=Nocardia takedensis TaxID=259390 RepID=UPI0002E61C7D|nr:FAD-dependent oxidoreductase [Nocardia takedensis]